MAGDPEDSVLRIDDERHPIPFIPWDFTVDKHVLELLPALKAERPQRVAGAQVVLHQGALIGWIPRTERNLLSFVPEAEPERTQSSIALARALTDEAVAATRGRILEYRGAPIKALYTSACGGHTEDVENVFGGGREGPYLRGVVCAPERSTRLRASVPWRVRMSPGEVARAVSRYGTLSDVQDVKPRRLGVSGRVVEIAVIGRR